VTSPCSRNAIRLSPVWEYRDGQPVKGELEKIEDRVEIVREIFERYAKGHTPRQIADDLNARKVSSPYAGMIRGGKEVSGQWTAQTLSGNNRRAAGIVRCEVYIGRLTIGKTRSVKIPEMSEAVVRIGTEPDTTAEALHLRIISDKLWTLFRIASGNEPAKIPAISTPLVICCKVLKCGCCGIAVSSIGRYRDGRFRMMCVEARQGRCSNKRRVYREVITEAVLSGLRETLSDKKAVAAYVEAQNEERRKLAKTATNRRAKLEKRQAENKREDERAVDAILKGVAVEATQERIARLEAETQSDSARPSCHRRRVERGHSQYRGGRTVPQISMTRTLSMPCVPSWIASRSMLQRAGVQ
jgi:site-specific DNA recombinase